MKRLSLVGFVGIFSILAGCPIYDGDGMPPDPMCTDPSCAPNPRCSSDQECNFNETCGSDNQCHPGDCTSWGCPTGLTCVVNSDLTASCQEGTGSSSSSTGSSSSSSSSGGTSSSSTSSSSSSSSGNPPPPIYCGNPSDCSAGETCAPNGTCQPGACAMIGCIFGYACTANGCVSVNPLACGEDIDCANAGIGYACISGICTPPMDQCSDQTQCPANNKCVAGKCTAACATDNDCTNGFGCDTALGICTLAIQGCTITNDCMSPAKVCVAGTCVPRSQQGMCPAGQVWVENGCIPSQTPLFVCGTDGVQDACAVGSICLHHNCYISCAPPNSMICDNLQFNVCKPVTTVSGTHEVCGSDGNLGNECDPTAGIVCAPGKICIDGFCK